MQHQINKLKKKKSKYQGQKKKKSRRREIIGEHGSSTNYFSIYKQRFTFLLALYIYIYIYIYIYKTISF